MKARWKRRDPGVMNEGECAWKSHLEGDVFLKSSLGDTVTVERVLFEAMTLRLAKLTRYTPDFMVLLSDGTIEFHEVKGSWKAPGQDDSRVKIKVAAEIFPWFVFRSVVVKKKPKKAGGGWDFQVERIG